MNIGIWTVELCDDGTLDTVVRCEMRIQPSIAYEFRWSDTSHLRDEHTGALTNEGWQELSREAAECAYEEHALMKCD
jgi:hypothetical protein